MRGAARALSLLAVFFALFLAFLASFSAYAVEPDEVLPDAGLEARARVLSRELRCMVCQNESIDDSHAPLARDLRLIVRERLKAGDSDQAVLAFLTARYGDFVLLRPRFKAETVLLWVTPAVVFILGTGLALVVLRQHRRKQAAPPALDEAEQAELQRLLADEAPSLPKRNPTDSLA